MSEKNEETKVFQFNKATNIETYKEILKILGIDKNIEEIVEESPKKDGAMFGNFLENQFESKEQRKLQAQNVLKDILDGKIEFSEGISKEQKSIIEMYFSQMMEDYLPYDTVLTAGEAVAGKDGFGQSLQMGCGQGKTGVLAFAAYTKMKAGEQVFLTSSTPILAAEALDTFEYYNNLGVADKLVLVKPDGIERAKKDENGNILLDKNNKVVRQKISFDKIEPEKVENILKTIYEKMPIVISDNATLMEHQMDGLLTEPKENGKERTLLADEADFVLLDSYRPIQKTGQEIDRKRARIYAYHIYENVVGNFPKRLQAYIKDDDNQYADFTEEGKKDVINRIKQVFEKEMLTSELDMNQMYDFVHDALVADTVYKENRDYQILDDGKVLVSEDRASGVEVDFPQGIKQALVIKLKKEGRYNRRNSKRN